MNDPRQSHQATRERSQADDVSLAAGTTRFLVQSRLPRRFDVWLQRRLRVLRQAVGAQAVTS